VTDRHWQPVVNVHGLLPSAVTPGKKGDRRLFLRDAEAAKKTPVPFFPTADVSAMDG
jgi:hypothetical protein